MEEDKHNSIETLETQLSFLKFSIVQEAQRLDRLKSQLELTNSQYKIYSQEAVKLQSSLQSCTENFSQEICKELHLLKGPLSSLYEICDKLLLILDIKNRSWKSFRSLCKHFLAFKHLLESATTEIISESVINEVLPLWKSQKNIRLKLGRCAGGHLLLNWIGLKVELNLKNELLAASQKRIPELEKMIRKQGKVLAKLISESLRLEENFNEMKNEVQLGDYELENCSELSFASRAENKNKLEKEKHMSISAVHRGSATGGLMEKIAKGSPKKNDPGSVFPNFNSAILYDEVPIYKQKENDDQIIYEGRNEMIGCCRAKFFCF